MKTRHVVNIGNSQNLDKIEDKSINLVVTSPPYPMIEMWDETFNNLNSKIGEALKNEDGTTAYNLMHNELNKVWEEVDRVLTDGGIICINIGDATRKVRNNFQLYSNHSKIINFFENKGYHVLPDIIWIKQTNKPNKFMGSGMLPTNAYVSLEHEYILIFRKKHNRIFKSNEDKENRKKSAYFWEERNKWFSDVWTDIKGTLQNMNNKKLRERNGSYPFELAYRLINMYSVKGDTILDPFLGTGTTMIASLACQRNSIGYEIDSNFEEFIKEKILGSKESLNEYINNRINKHIEFVNRRIQEKGPLKYNSNKYDFNVMTSQEKEMSLSLINNLNEENNIIYASYNLIKPENVRNNSLKTTQNSVQITLKNTS